MTYQPNYTLPREWVEVISEGGLDALPELIRILVNTAMEAEREIERRTIRELFPGAGR